MSGRISPASPPYSPPIQAILDRIMPEGLPPLMLFRVLARDERLFQRFAGGGLLDRGHLTLRERELVILRVCANNRSEYEWGVHVAAFSAKAGLDPEEVEATRCGDVDAPCWTDGERLLLRVCDALAVDTALPDALWGSLRAAHSEEAVLEILLLNGFYRTVSILTNTLQLAPEAWAARFPSA
jgi:alkylhydroperoxidase family enzyme